MESAAAIWVRGVPACCCATISSRTGWATALGINDLPNRERVEETTPQAYHRCALADPTRPRILRPCPTAHDTEIPPYDDLSPSSPLSPYPPCLHPFRVSAPSRFPISPAALATPLPAPGCCGGRRRGAGGRWRFRA